MKEIVTRSGVVNPRTSSNLNKLSIFLKENWDFVLVVLSGVLLLAVIWDDTITLSNFLSPARLILGLIFGLFVPGYCLQAALFPRNSELDTPERLALSFGFSIAIIPPLALLLDQFPWGIRLWPIALSLAGTILVFSLAAIVRRLRLPAEERFIPAIEMDLKGWWAVQDRTSRRLYVLLPIALGVALFSALAIVLLPRPGDRFTEFYMLGPDGLAESYPREASPGQAISVTVGIHNLEGEDASYRVEVQDGQGTIGNVGPFLVKAGGTEEGPIFFSPVEIGEDVEILFYLYKDGQTQPYRSLRLFLKVGMKAEG